jgi:hypothetical protein
LRSLPVINIDIRFDAENQVNKTHNSILLMLSKPYFYLIWLNGLGDCSEGFFGILPSKEISCFLWIANQIAECADQKGDDQWRHAVRKLVRSLELFAERQE